MVRKAIEQNKETQAKINTLVDSYQEKKRTSEFGGSTLFASKNESWLIDQVKQSIENSKRELETIARTGTSSLSVLDKKIGFLSKQF